MKAKIAKDKQEALRDLKTGIDLIRTPATKEKAQVVKVAKEKTAVDGTMRD